MAGEGCGGARADREGEGAEEAEEPDVCDLRRTGRRVSGGVRWGAGPGARWSGGGVSRDLDDHVAHFGVRAPAHERFVEGVQRGDQRPGSEHRAEQVLPSEARGHHGTLTGMPEAREKCALEHVRRQHRPGPRL